MWIATHLIRMSKNQTITCSTVPVSALLIRPFTSGNTDENLKISDTIIEPPIIPKELETNGGNVQSDTIQTVPFSSHMLKPLPTISEQKTANSSPDIEHFVKSEPFGPSATIEVNALESDYKKYRLESRAIRMRPDSFISVRITSDTLLSKLSSIQSELVASDPRTAAALISPLTFHITLLPIYTGDSGENVESAKLILKQSVEQFRAEYTGNLSLTFQGLEHFSNRVLFASIFKDEYLENLTLLAKCLANKFKSNYKYKSDEKSEFQAHLTLAKTSKSRKKSRKNRLKSFNPDLTQELISKHSKCIHGEERVESVELLSMIKNKEPDGYYYCYDTFSLRND